MRWRYFTWMMAGNLHDLARMLRESRPQWDVVVAEVVGCNTIALCRVPWDSPTDSWEGK